MTKTQLIVVGGGIELFVRELGERHPGETSLLVLHGGPSWDHTYLLPGLQPLAHTRHIVLFDMRGCGRSSRDLDPSSYQPEYVVEDTHHLINGLGLGAVDLLGFSTGGQVAQLFAEAHPDQVRRLVLVSTTAYPDVSPYLQGWAEYERRVSEVVPSDVGANHLGATVQWARDSAPKAIWNLDLLPAYLELLDQVRFSGDWLGPLLAGELHPWRPADPAEVLRELNRPILILHGAQDMVFPVDVAFRLRADVPNSELVIIDQAGHMAHFEQPGGWAMALDEFLTAPKG